MRKDEYSKKDEENLRPLKLNGIILITLQYDSLLLFS